MNGTLALALLVAVCSVAIRIGASAESSGGGDTAAERLAEERVRRHYRGRGGGRGGRGRWPGGRGGGRGDRPSRFGSHGRWPQRPDSSEYYSDEDYYSEEEVWTTTTRRPATTRRPRIVTRPSTRRPRIVTRPSTRQPSTNSAVCGTADASHKPFIRTDAKNKLLSTGTRVIGGSEARPHSHPYMARMVGACGAVILDDRWVITAAHCVYGERTSSMRISLGDHHVRERESGQTTCGVDRVVMHPQYSRSTDANDFALLKLQCRIPFTSTIRPICLPDGRTNYRDDQNARRRFVVLGWGAQQRASSSRVLKQAVVPGAQSRCSSTYGRHNIMRSMVCAGGNGKDACEGDSGGPLLALRPGTKDQYELVGITSWGDETCGDYDYPGVYAYVPSALRWINSVIGR